MLMNNLDPEVAENPRELVVYGGIGRAARNWECYDRIVETLKQLNDDETLLVQSGKPVGVFKTHANAPRVLIANSNLVPHWATWEHFNELDAKGLAMYGQMTAGSWIYIGSQGIVQGTYETFVEAGRQHYDGNLKGRWVLTAGLGGMGGAQPLAATLAGACSLNIECQQSRIDFRLRSRYVDEQARTWTTPWRGSSATPPKARPSPSPCWAMPPRSFRNWFAAAYARTWSPTRPAPTIHSTATCRPAGAWEEYRDRAQTDPAAVVKAAKQSMAVHVRAMLAFQQQGVPTFDYGNNIRQMAKEEGWPMPSISPASSRPTSARCSVAASVRSAGPRCRATRRTSTRPTPRSSN